MRQQVDHRENGLRDETIQSRALEISYQGKKWNEITDLGALSNTSYSGYNWRSSEGKLPSGEDNMSVQLKVTAKGGREVLSNVDQISVKQFSISNVVAEHLADKTRETYNLILFTYNKSDMGNGITRSSMNMSIIGSSRIRTFRSMDIPIF